MMPARRILWSQLRIGVVTSLAVTTIALVIFFVDQVRDAVEPRYSLCFQTFTSQNLRLRAPVWLAGQPVGYVVGVTFGPPASGTRERLRVDLSIRAEARPFITEGATAQVITAGLLGEAVVNIVPAVEAGEPLSDGATLPAASEIDALEVTRRLETLSDSVRPVADRWTAVLRQARDGRGTLPQLVREPGELGELRDRLNQMSEAFADLSGAAGGLSSLLSDHEVRAALGRIGPRVERLAARWAAGEGTAGQLARDTVVRAHLATLTRSIQRLSERLESGHGTLGRFLNDEALASEFARTRAMLRELEAGLEALRGGARPRS
jgi:phospholipid/cholesterol/gamma-HCH transport system substrate-binding protein